MVRLSGNIIGAGGLAVAIYATFGKPRSSIEFVGPDCAAEWKNAGKSYPTKTCLEQAISAHEMRCGIRFTCAATRGDLNPGTEITYAYGYDTTGIKDISCGSGWQAGGGFNGICQGSGSHQ